MLEFYTKVSVGQSQSCRRYHLRNQMDAIASSSTAQDMALPTTLSKRDDTSLDVQWNFHVNALMEMLHTERAALKEERAALEKEKAIWYQAATRLEATQIAEPVTLNVGGTMFATSREVLLKLPNSYFGAMMSGRWALQHSADGSLFIDRSPDVFGYIMDYLRGYPSVDFASTWMQMEEEKRAQLKDECDFYNMPELLKDAPLITHAQQTSMSSFPSRLRDFLRGQVMLPFNFTPKLLYQWSVDGPGAEKFHKKCDDQGCPTITVGMLTDGRLVGGYTSIPWSSSIGFKVDSTAFLFIIPVESDQRIQYFAIHNDRIKNAVYHQRSCGPVFGSSDLCFVPSTLPMIERRFPYVYPAHGIAHNTPLVDFCVWSIVPR